MHVGSASSVYELALFCLQIRGGNVIITGYFTFTDGVGAFFSLADQMAH